MSGKTRDVRYSWIPDPPNGARLLPGQWSWRVFDGKRDLHVQCYCDTLMYLPAEVYRLNAQGVVLTRLGRGFGTHGNGRCFKPGRMVLLGWAEHQLEGA